MTDNEKAATFIGWTPNFEVPNKGGALELIDAPDMSDPRNYMKAFSNAAREVGEVPKWWWAEFNRAIWGSNATPLVELLAMVYEELHGEGDAHEPV